MAKREKQWALHIDGSLYDRWWVPEDDPEDAPSLCDTVLREFFLLPDETDEIVLCLSSSRHREAYRVTTRGRESTTLDVRLQGRIVQVWVTGNLADAVWDFTAHGDACYLSIEYEF